MARPRRSAAVLARRRRVALLKIGEQALAHAGFNADAGIADGKPERHALRRLVEDTDGDSDLAGLGEFDRVADEVDENLPDAQRVADEIGGHVLVDLDKKFEALVLGFAANDATDVGQHLPEIELDALDAHLAGLDLRQIEDVVDDAEQDAARRSGFCSDSRAGAAKSSVAMARCAMPRMAFIGVRISWLMLARNSDLVRAAASASAWARRSSLTAARSTVMSSSMTTTPLARSSASMARAERRTQNVLPSLRRHWLSFDVALDSSAASRRARRPRRSIRCCRRTGIQQSGQAVLPVRSRSIPQGGDCNAR